MANRPSRKQRTDTSRARTSGPGKRGPKTKGRVQSAPEAAGRDADDLAAVRDRLIQEREEMAARLRDLGISPASDADTPRAGIATGLDEGDQAQASERQDMSFATRERLAVRVERLAAALERIERGTYGRCVECGGLVEPERLAVMPEADTCLACQERRESGAEGTRAA
jgi:DnaK suppressor protein